MKNTVILLLALIIGTSCSGKKEKNPPSQSDLKVETFARVYTHYLNALLADSTAAENQESLLDSVVEQSGLTMEEFKEILYDLREHPGKFNDALSITIDSLAAKARRQSQEQHRP